MPGLFTAPKQFPSSFAQAASAEKVHDLGGFDFHVIQVTPPTQYPNPAGIPCPASLFACRSMEWVMPICTKLGLRDLAFDPATGNIHAFVSSTGVEVANGVDLSADLFFLMGAGIR